MQKLGRFLGGLTICVASGVASTGVAQAQPATLSLHDGTSIRGTVQSLQDGVYTIASKSLGTVKIRTSEIKSLSYGTAEPAAGGASISAAQVNAMSSRLLSDPAVLTLIQSLGTDPQVRNVLNDPEVRAALSRGDYESLMNNAKIMKLLDHKTIQAIGRKVR